MFGRLEDVRRIATRYESLAANYLAVFYVTAAVSHWL